MAKHEKKVEELKMTIAQLQHALHVVGNAVELFQFKTPEAKKGIPEIKEEEADEE